MSLHSSQLGLLLELLPGAARLENPSDEVVAQNHAAVEVAAIKLPPLSAPPQWEISDLGGGYHLHFIQMGARCNANPEHLPDDINALVRGMAHEIRNPLSAILTAVDLVQDAPGVDEETALLLDVVRKEARRMNRILTEFGAYVKPPNPQPDAFDLMHAARNAVETLRRERDSELSFQDDLPAQAMVCADETQIRQALERVLQNAVDAMPQGGKLRLTSEADDDSVTLCIEDSGPGFSPESLEHAFQPFYSTKPSDTGLGLSITRAVIEAAGGRIWIENSLSAADHQGHGGARVCLELPSAPQPS